MRIQNQIRNHIQKGTQIIWMTMRVKSSRGCPYMEIYGTTLVYLYIYICADNRWHSEFAEEGALVAHIGGLRAYIGVSEIRIDF